MSFPTYKNYIYTTFMLFYQYAFAWDWIHELLRRRPPNDEHINPQLDEQTGTLFSAHKDADAAALVAGTDGIPIGGGPGEEGSMLVREGLALFRTQSATLEPWVFTPSAAFFTVVINTSSRHLCTWLYSYF